MTDDNNTSPTAADGDAGAGPSREAERGQQEQGQAGSPDGGRGWDHISDADRIQRLTRYSASVTALLAAPNEHQPARDLDRMKRIRASLPAEYFRWEQQELTRPGSDCGADTYIGWKGLVFHLEASFGPISAADASTLLWTLLMLPGRDAAFHAIGSVLAAVTRKAAEGCLANPVSLAVSVIADKRPSDNSLPDWIRLELQYLQQWIDGELERLCPVPAARQDRPMAPKADIRLDAQVRANLEVRHQAADRARAAGRQYPRGTYQERMRMVDEEGDRDEEPREDTAGEEEAAAEPEGKPNRGESKAERAEDQRERAEQIDRSGYGKSRVEPGRNDREEPEGRNDRQQYGRNDREESEGRNDRQRYGRGDREEPEGRNDRQRYGRGDREEPEGRNDRQWYGRSDREEPEGRIDRQRYGRSDRVEAEGRYARQRYGRNDREETEGRNDRQWYGRNDHDEPEGRNDRQQYGRTARDDRQYGRNDRDDRQYGRNDRQQYGRGDWEEDSDDGGQETADERRNSDASSSAAERGRMDSERGRMDTRSKSRGRFDHGRTVPYRQRYDRQQPRRYYGRN